MRLIIFLFLIGIVTVKTSGQLAAPSFLLPRRATNAEVQLLLTGRTGTNYRIDSTRDALTWEPLVSLEGRLTNSHTDSAAPFSSQRFYRAQEIGTNSMTGDHIVTPDGDVVIHPVNHASFLMSWKELTIYNDAVGSSNLYRTFPKADLLLVSHSHGDHYNSTTISAVKQTNGVIIVPPLIYNMLSGTLRAAAIPLPNGSSTNVRGVTIEAVPAYNANHPKGDGNGYVITLGGKRFYMSGDTGDAPEIRALKNIDVAFLSMNIPFTMNVPTAAAVARDFRPRILYPYHYRNQDGTFANMNELKRLLPIETQVEVRTRAWY